MDPTNGLKQEVDLIQEEKQDLLARLMGAQAMGRFLLRAYHAFKNYSVDFLTLPEWLNNEQLDRARKMRPHAAQHHIIDYFMKLENALTAAIRRKQFSLHKGGKATEDENTE